MHTSIEHRIAKTQEAIIERHPCDGSPMIMKIESSYRRTAIRWMCSYCGRRDTVVLVGA